MEERRLNGTRTGRSIRHSNDDILEVGVLLEDCHEENGPLLIIPESHKGPD